MPPTELPFTSRRSVVYSKKGLIASTQPLACSAGIEILNAGGNAADAAVAVSAALNVTEPGSCGIGGDAFCIFYDATTKKLTTMNGSGRSPKALSLQKARELGLTGAEIPLLNINAVTVPGCAAAWVDTLTKFGSGNVSLKDVLAPAIRLAEEGAPISEISSYHWTLAEPWLRKVSKAGHEMLVDGHAPRPGELFKNPTLARTFRTLVEEGKDGFYKGRIGQAIVDLIQSKGGVMTLEDLASHKTQFDEPISYTYQNSFTLHEPPPNNSGLTVLIALGIVDALQKTGKVDLNKVEHNSAQWMHILIESLRLAFADARAYICDPEHHHVAIKELLSDVYLSKRASLINLDKATVDVVAGSPLAHSDTVLFTTADQYGNACAYIQSNYAGFGSHAVPEGCGFTLHNRGSNFFLKEGHANCLQGGKRPYHTIIPAAVTKANGELYVVFGVMGGFMQVQGQLQVLLNMIHHNATPQQALDLPRFCISAGMPSLDNDSISACDMDSEISVEEGLKPELYEQLRQMGHSIKVQSGHGRGQFGRGQIIMAQDSSCWAGGSDPRGDGHAAPQV